MHDHLLSNETHSCSSSSSPQNYKYSSNPVYRSSFLSIPNDPTDFHSTQIPWSITINHSSLLTSPNFINLNSDNDTDPVYRCSSCRSYLSPFCEVIDPGYQWICCMCFFVNHLDVPFRKVKIFSDTIKNDHCYENVIGCNNNINSRNEYNDYINSSNNQYNDINNYNNNQYDNINSNNNSSNNINSNNNEYNDFNSNNNSNINSNNHFNKNMNINNNVNDYDGMDNENKYSTKNNLINNYNIIKNNHKAILKPSSDISFPKFDPLLNLAKNKQYDHFMLQSLSYDTFSPGNVVFKLPPPPISLFCIDCSSESIKNGVLECILMNINKILFNRRVRNENIIIRDDFKDNIKYTKDKNNSNLENIITDYFNENIKYTKDTNNSTIEYKSDNIKYNEKNLGNTTYTQLHNENIHDNINYNKFHDKNIHTQNHNKCNDNSFYLDDPRSLAMFIFYNHHVHILKNTNEFDTLSDTNTLPFLLSSQYHFNPNCKKDHIDVKSIISYFTSQNLHSNSNSNLTSKIGEYSALKISSSLLKNTGGTIYNFISSKTNLNSQKTVENENTSFSLTKSLNFLSTDLVSPNSNLNSNLESDVNKNKEMLIRNFTEYKIGYNVFVFPHSDINMYCLYDLVIKSGGMFFYYPNFSSRDGCFVERLENEMERIFGFRKEKSRENDGNLDYGNGNLDKSINYNSFNESFGNKRNLVNHNSSNIAGKTKEYLNEGLGNTRNISNRNSGILLDKSYNSGDETNLACNSSDFLNKSINSGNLDSTVYNSNVLNYNPVNKNNKFHYPLIGIDGVSKIRCTSGIKIKKYYGSFTQHKTDLLTYPNYNPTNNTTIELDYTNYNTKINETRSITFQSAVLRSVSGKRKIHVVNFCIPIKEYNSGLDFYLDIERNELEVWNSNLYFNKKSNVYDCLDINQIIRFWSILAVIQSKYGKEPMIGQNYLKKQLNNVMTKFHSSNTNSFVDKNIKSLPILVLSLLKSIPLRNTKQTPLDYRVFYSSILLSGSNSICDQIIYPLLVPLHRYYSNFERIVEGKYKLRKIEISKLSLEDLETDGLYVMDTGISIFIFVGCECREEVYRCVVKDHQKTGRIRIEIDLENKEEERNVRAVKNLLYNVVGNRKDTANIVLVRDNDNDNESGMRNQSVYRDIFFSYFVEDRGFGMESGEEWEKKIFSETQKNGK